MWRYVFFKRRRREYTDMNVTSSLAPHVPTPEDVVRKMLELADLKIGEHVYDLGSGDGRIIIMAAKDFGATAVGVELREDLVQFTEKKIGQLGLNDKVKVIRGDLLKADIKEANVVTLYLTTSANEKLAPKLEGELRPGTRVVSYCFRMPSWEPTKTVDLENRTLYLYTLPPTRKD